LTLANLLHLLLLAVFFSFSLAKIALYCLDAVEGGVLGISVFESSYCMHMH